MHINYKLKASVVAGLWYRSCSVQCSCSCRASSGRRSATGPTARLRTGCWIGGFGLWRVTPRGTRLARAAAEHRYTSLQINRPERHTRTPFYLLPSFKNYPYQSYFWGRFLYIHSSQSIMTLPHLCNYPNNHTV